MHKKFTSGNALFLLLSFFAKGANGLMLSIDRTYNTRETPEIFYI